MSFHCESHLYNNCSFLISTNRSLIIIAWKLDLLSFVVKICYNVMQHKHNQIALVTS